MSFVDGLALRSNRLCFDDKMITLRNLWKNKDLKHIHGWSKHHSLTSQTIFWALKLEKTEWGHPEDTLIWPLQRSSKAHLVNKIGQYIGVFGIKLYQGMLLRHSILSQRIFEAYLFSNALNSITALEILLVPPLEQNSPSVQIH